MQKSHMNDPGLQDQIDAAKDYDSLLGPALFNQWVTKVTDAANIQPGQRVLDVACGTGLLSREISSRATASVYVAGLDPSPGMLAVAKELAPAIDWNEGVAESLPFPDDSFDTVVSQFGLMFFTDRHQAVREMIRILKPGGRIVVAVWDSLANITAYADFAALVNRLAGKQAADLISTPFCLGDRKALATLFTNAGASSVDIATHTGTARFPSITEMVEADLRGWLPVMGVVLTEEQIGQVLHEAEDVLGPYVTSAGKVVFEAPAHIITSVKE